jgi:hypothetical protein
MYKLFFKREMAGAHRAYADVAGLLDIFGHEKCKSLFGHANGPKIGRSVADWYINHDRLVELHTWKVERAKEVATEIKNGITKVPTPTETATPRIKRVARGPKLNRNAKGKTKHSPVAQSSSDESESSSSGDSSSDAGSDDEELADEVHSEFDGDPASLVGRKISSYFPECGCDYEGGVKDWEEEEGTGRILYGVEYEDGDKGDFYWPELEKRLLERESIRSAPLWKDPAPPMVNSWCRGRASKLPAIHGSHATTFTPN